MKSALLRMTAWLAGALPVRIRRLLYHLGPISRALRSTLNRVAPTGLTEVIVASGPMKGVRLRLDMQIEKDVWLGNYEPELLAMLKSITPSGGVAYDVGANIGLMSLAMAAFTGPDGQVVAFEALPANVDRLRANLSLNASGGQVQVEPVAVGAAPGSATFHVHASGGMGKLGGSAGRDEVYEKSIDVPVVSLDAYVFSGEHRPPAVVKIDVEGGEGMVLEGARRLLAEVAPTLLIEIHGPQAAAQVLGPLKSHGYSVHKLAHGLPDVSDWSDLDWKAHVVGLPPRSEGERD
jgi:FkbM family methyltransferase